MGLCLSFPLLINFRKNSGDSDLPGGDSSVAAGRALREGEIAKRFRILPEFVLGPEFLLSLSGYPRHRGAMGQGFSYTDEGRHSIGRGDCGLCK